MRILHTSDWHLGKTLEGFSRLQEQKEFIDELYQIAVENQVHLVLIAGDVYDVFNPSAEAEDLFYYALARLAENGTRAVVAIAGNHDNPERLAAPEYLARHQGITLVGFPKDTVCLNTVCLEGKGVQRTASGPGWVRLQVPGCDHQATLITLAYPSETRLRELFHFTHDEAKTALEYRQKVQQVLNTIAGNFKKDTVNIILSHLFYAHGQTSDSERILSIGGLNAIQFTDLPSAGHVQYVALGHLHKPQSFHNGSYPVYYSGSPLAYSFSEAGQQKKVILADIEPGQEAKITEIPLRCGLPLVKKKCLSYQEALDWCSENTNQWVDLEIVHHCALTSIEMKELKDRHKNIVNIRVSLPVEQVRESEIRRLAELSLIEKFVAFYKAKKLGAEPAQELLDLFIELTQDLEERND